MMNLRSDMSYPKGYEKLFLHNTRLLESEEIIFAVKFCESLFDLLTNISKFFEPPTNEKFIIHLVTNMKDK